MRTKYLMRWHYAEMESVPDFRLHASMRCADEILTYYRALMKSLGFREEEKRFGKTSTVLGRTVYFGRGFGKRPRDEQAQIMAHEIYHVCTIQRVGRPKFYRRWLTDVRQRFVWELCAEIQREVVRKRIGHKSKFDGGEFVRFYKLRRVDNGAKTAETIIRDAIRTTPGYSPRRGPATENPPPKPKAGCVGTMTMRPDLHYDVHVTDGTWHWRQVCKTGDPSQGGHVQMVMTDTYIKGPEWPFRILRRNTDALDPEWEIFVEER